MKKKILIIIIAVSISFTLFAQQKPNVIFIMADDMGYGDLGCYGQQLIVTPNIDKLAASGMLFTDFYAGTSVCAPSRAAMMTGKHTGHTAIRGNHEIQPEGQLALPDSAYTMAEMFKKAGYTTGNFGKWGLGFVGSPGDPVKQGFDQFFGYNCQRQSHNFFPDHLWDNDKRIDYPNSVTNQQYYAPEIIQQKALDFIDVNKAKPFFLYLSYTLPHAALQLPDGDKIFAAYKVKFNEHPKPVKDDWNGTGYQPQAYPHAAYAAMVTKLDDYVGEVMKKVKELEIEKNTLIFFTSDNGPHREGGNDPDFFNSSSGFRGNKRDLYEGGIRVPMIVSWPGVIKKGKRSGLIGASWDFLPTFSKIAGQPILPGSDGISILPSLNAKGEQKKHDYLYWEFHEDGGTQAVRMGNWKGVRLNVMKEKNSPVQLYNLAIDPKETKDVANHNPTVVEKIKRIMQQAHVENKDFPFF